MFGSIIVKRDPVAVGVVLTAALLLVGGLLGWEAELTGSLTALVAAGVGVVQSSNVFGSDKFTALAVNFGAAGIAVFVAWGVPVSDELATLILGVVVAVLGLMVRNGVTNRFDELGNVSEVVPAPGAAEANGAGFR